MHCKCMILVRDCLSFYRDAKICTAGSEESDGKFLEMYHKEHGVPITTTIKTEGDDTMDIDAE